MILSVVIPMYNAEDYISNCLDSLLEQNLCIEEYEILVINDGSKDKSQKIVESYIKKYSNIILYNQENSGNGAARNRGIGLARGKYLYFIDSDDYIAVNVLSGLINILDKNKLDIIGFNSVNTFNSSLKDSNNLKILEDNSNLKIIKGTEFIAENNYRAEVWWYIVNRDFFNSTGVTFYNRKFVQDAFITPKIFIKANKVLFLPIDVHRYRQNENSITNKKSPEHLKKHINDLLFSIEQLATLIESIKDRKAIKRLKNRQQGYVFFLLLRFPKSNLSFNKLKEIIKRAKLIKAYPLLEFLGKDYNGVKYQLLVFIFNHRFLLYPFLLFYRLFYRLFS